MTSTRRATGSPQIRRAYAFLADAERQEQSFTSAELSTASGWTEKTTRANLSKKLTQIVQRTGDGYRCFGAIELGEEGFCRICSQNSAITNDPRRPPLNQHAEELVIKARESVLAAVQHYNNPAALFRSGNYLVLMIISYTALFHAIFERDGIDYIERKNDGSPKLTKDGECYHWDALYSARHYEQEYAGRYEKGFLKAVATNIELLLPLRHKVEHRHMPQLDLDIGGHCQAMLMNFERIIAHEFTSYYALNPSLSLALQFSTARPAETVNALRRLQSAEYNELREQISHFHANLSNEIAGHMAFEFRVWLIQKPANRERGSDLSIEYIPTDQLSDEAHADLQRVIIAIKGVPDDFAKHCNLWEKEVLDQVRATIGNDIQYGTGHRKLSGLYIRQARDAHNITSPSNMYYRPGRADSRAMYSSNFVHWLIDNYQRDPDFFYNARPVNKHR